MSNLKSITTQVPINNVVVKSKKKPKVTRQSRPGIGVQLLTAGSAACVADLFTFPLDTAKVRLQV